MLFNSLNFIIFFPIVLFIYWCIPDRLRRIWLLAASWFFYACFDIRCLFILIGITIITYTGGRVLGRIKDHRKVITICLISVCIGLLGIFKYLTFFTELLNEALHKFHMSLSLPVFSLIIPAGISFYSFKAVSYIVDVYRNEQAPEESFIDYAVYISFFPQIVAGPIDRAYSLLAQIKESRTFKESDLRTGALLMLYGYFEKFLVADRISLIVDAIYDNHTAYSGAAIAMATICYGIQIYADFAGYSYLSIGAARILGFKVSDNFRQPYFAVGIRDFWKRWHISMSSWFKDYLYIPLGGSRKGKRRKTFSNMITFLLSGLWHGSSLNFIVWGGLHGIFHLMAELTGTRRKTICEKYGIRNDTFGRRLYKVIMTFLMVDYAWMFFRAKDLATAVDMTRRILTDFRGYTLSREFIFSLGFPEAYLNGMVLAASVMIFVDILHERKLSIIKWLDEQGIVFRWMCYMAATLTVFLGAVQNLGQSSNSFIYFRF